ncbi:HNH endonuclease signature motif containing protein [Salipiger thiooxidans]|uniref:HNH endonuclease signature motif containing protein n=1 Tax=Salipiger thiooxidans TaxID=282683 RepID=UPI001CD721F9|nr:HNH endonuclease signature motif containing protein [Salipiger thiooxidans]MCA0846099.1 HNH endonuclease [Salipiger thiooxidans]
MNVDLLKRRLAYDPSTGVLSWRDGPRAGRQAGTISSGGYVVIFLEKKRIKAHRAAWAIHYGAAPKDQIDHINRVKTDNRISNLRDVTNTENQKNKGARGR